MSKRRKSRAIGKDESGISGHLATWGGDIPYELHLTAAPAAWICTCAKGSPKSEGYPCGHIRDAWEKAKHGLQSNSWDWTAIGLEKGRHCLCRGETEEQALQLQPPKERPPAPVGPSRNKPCPCGSMRSDGAPYLFKYCHALPEGQRPPEAGWWSADGAPPIIATPGIPEEVKKELARGKRRVRYAVKVREERARRDAGRARMDEVLERIHAKEEAKRERDRARRAAKKAQAAK